MPAETAAQFQTDKPFRLSLYVRPENLAAITNPKVNLDKSVTTPEGSNDKENRGAKRRKRNDKENKNPRKTNSRKTKAGKLKEQNVNLFVDENIPPVKKKRTTKKVESKKSTTTDEPKNKLNDTSSQNEITQEDNEDDEFEKWAQSMNEEFSDIEKFELSVTYDD